MTILKSNQDWGIMNAGFLFIHFIYKQIALIGSWSVNNNFMILLLDENF